MTGAADAVLLVPAETLEARVRDVLLAAGADEPSAGAATRAVMHASRLGVDSHGVRLAPHYAAVLRNGRVNGRPRLTTHGAGGAGLVLDADDGLGHLAAYEAMRLACERAGSFGIGAVGVRRSSHFGAAGAYALAAAEVGFIGICTSNADSIVALHGGTQPFHGTNPIAAAAPVRDSRPWLLDMATSSVPLNRVHLYATLGLALPEGVAADAEGRPTTEAALARSLLPLGGTAYGFKGAGLAGLATILSATLTGAVPDPFMLPMGRDGDVTTHRNVGHFCIAMDPSQFIGRDGYDDAIGSYLGALRSAPVREGEAAVAPGDREWRTERERLETGNPVDRDTARQLGL